MPRLYVGIDPAVSHWGACVLDEGGAVVATYALRTNPREPRRLTFARLIQHRSLEILDHVLAHEPDAHRVAIEVPLLHGNGALGRAALFGALCCQWPEAVLVAPSQLRKFAGAPGVGGKDLVRLAVFKRWKFEHPEDDVVDAYVLAQLARLGDPRVAAVRTREQLGVLGKIAAGVVR